MHKVKNKIVWSHHLRIINRHLVNIHGMLELQLAMLDNSSGRGSLHEAVALADTNQQHMTIISMTIVDQ